MLKTSYMLLRNITAIDTELYSNGVCLEREYGLQNVSVYYLMNN